MRATVLFVSTVHRKSVEPRLARHFSAIPSDLAGRHAVDKDEKEPGLGKSAKLHSFV